MTDTVKANSPVKSECKARSRGQTSNSTTAERKKAAGLNKMSDILFEKYEKIRKLQGTLNGQEAASKYEIGIHVAEVIKNENAYGARSVERLTEALGHHHSTLRGYARVADTWEPDEFKKLIKRLGKRRLPISFSHLVELSKIDDPAERDEWVDRVLKDGLSVRELRKQWADSVDTVPAASSDGQEVSSRADEAAEAEVDFDGQVDVVEREDDVAGNPVTVRRSLARLAAGVKAIEVDAREWEARVFEPLATGPGPLDDDLADDLRQISADTRKAIQVLRSRDKKIGELLNRADQATKPSKTDSVKEGGERDG